MSVRGWIHTRSRSCWISSSRRRHVSWRTFTSWSFFSSAASSWAIFSAGRAISATPSSPPPAATLLLLLVSQAVIERPRGQKSRPRSSLPLFPVPSPDEFVRQRAASSAGFPKGTARTNVFPGPAFKLSQRHQSEAVQQFRFHTLLHRKYIRQAGWCAKDTKLPTPQGFGGAKMVFNHSSVCIFGECLEEIPPIPALKPFSCHHLPLLLLRVWENAMHEGEARGRSREMMEFSILARKIRSCCSVFEKNTSVELVATWVQQHGGGAFGCTTGLPSGAW